MNSSNHYENQLAAIRTMFLLEWISSLPLRQQVTGTTNKIESYNGFAK